MPLIARIPRRPLLPVVVLSLLLGLWPSLGQGAGGPVRLEIFYPETAPFAYDTDTGPRGVIYDKIAAACATGTTLNCRFNRTASFKQALTRAILLPEGALLFGGNGKARARYLRYSDPVYCERVTLYSTVPRDWSAPKPGRRIGVIAARDYGRRFDRIARQARLVTRPAAAADELFALLRAGRLDAVLYSVTQAARRDDTATLFAAHPEMRRVAMVFGVNKTGPHARAAIAEINRVLAAQGWAAPCSQRNE